MCIRNLMDRHQITMRCLTEVLQNASAEMQAGQSPQTRRIQASCARLKAFHTTNTCTSERPRPMSGANQMTASAIFVRTHPLIDFTRTRSIAQQYTRISARDAGGHQSLSRAIKNRPQLMECGNGSNIQVTSFPLPCLSQAPFRSRQPTSAMRSSHHSYNNALQSPACRALKRAWDISPRQIRGKPRETSFIGVGTLSDMLQLRHGYRD